ncbi:hypothetical protein BKA70DRAFT_1481892 [Coprinopsis sp. MPI-PUGE-AT-0042]|nr:hypothetical protein BKA70DRAFT_1481892 [Coprinopsis sp. MPI-PUGE-AT-0042]
MSLWMHSPQDLAAGTGRFIIVNDLMALIVHSSFSTIQVSIACRLVEGLKKQGPYKACLRSTRRFIWASICLAFGYTLCSALYAASFFLKLDAVFHMMGRQAELGPEIQYLRFSKMDAALSGILQTMVLFADYLLVYRCYIMLKHHRIIWGLALFSTIPSIAFLVMQTLRPSESLIVYGALESVFTNIIVSPTLIFRLVKKQKEAEVLLQGTPREMQIPYHYLIFILTESASPPLVLGILSVVFFFAESTKDYTGWVFLLWISFTILRYRTLTLDKRHMR